MQLQVTGSEDGIISRTWNHGLCCSSIRVSWRRWRLDAHRVACRWRVRRVDGRWCHDRRVVVRQSWCWHVHRRGRHDLGVDRRRREDGTCDRKHGRRVVVVVMMVSSQRPVTVMVMAVLVVRRLHDIRRCLCLLVMRDSLTRGVGKGGRCVSSHDWRSETSVISSTGSKGLITGRLTIGKIRQMRSAGASPRTTTGLTD